jgi:hypothetical protein
MRRWNQVILIGSFVPFCWLAFMGVHELGHVLAGWLTGGSVNKVVFHPLTISRTDVEPNPQPLLVAWAGPILGIAIPLLVWGLIRLFYLPGDYLARFFAGFCLIANGAYIGIGSFENIGDAGEMRLHGSPIWVLWLFGIVTVPLGFQIWNGLGPRFGFGESRGRVDPWAAYVSLGLFVLLFAGSLLISPRN